MESLFSSFLGGAGSEGERASASASQNTSKVINFGGSSSGAMSKALYMGLGIAAALLAVRYFKK